jgi:phosphoglycolate phosphatase
MKTARRRHLLWDWNGTLLDDTRACVSALNTMLRERGLPAIDSLFYRRWFGFPVRDFYRCLGLRPDDGGWEEMAVRFHDLYLREPVEVAAAAHTALERVAAAGLPQSVLSACEQEMLESLVGRHGLRGYFRHIQGTDSLDGDSKVEAGRQLLARLGHDPQDLLLVGDTLHDAEVAEALGCGCLLIAAGHQTAARLRRSGRPVLASLSEFVAESEDLLR